ncbi:hypothetical protein B0I33_114101 [Prauserella shujinwangii]|uniref:Uncharacterized protein n=1 Tax=Prauserella shujinwangii TaxID=1453103 RepID=A0A2T0LL04_9PSEU|nr:hypothetical protein [Prauserella shujinwangii]PRX43640.1 hypothetical protein B0I33_114101 [Prauserella shujinwangii]
MRRDGPPLFRCGSSSATDHPPLARHTPLPEWHWNGPPRHGVTFRGTIAEWSLDAVGLLAAVLTGAAAEHGVTTPVLLTVGRDDLPPGFAGVSSLPPPARA